jgi:hypothetical protein
MLTPLSYPMGESAKMSQDAGWISRTLMSIPVAPFFLILFPRSVRHLPFPVIFVLLHFKEEYVRWVLGEHDDDDGCSPMGIGFSACFRGRKPCLRACRLSK